MEEEDNVVEDFPDEDDIPGTLKSSIQGIFRRIDIVLQNCHFKDYQIE